MPKSVRELVSHLKGTLGLISGGGVGEGRLLASRALPAGVRKLGDFSLNTENLRKDSMPPGAYPILSFAAGRRRLAAALTWYRASFKKVISSSFQTPPVQVAYGFLGATTWNRGI